MRVLLIDGHPDADRLSARLLDLYALALPEGCAPERLALRDLDFDVLATRSYEGMPAMEPDLARLFEAIRAADHIVLAFPMWWGGAPALVQGTVERLFLPGQSFAYHTKDPFWDKLLKGRSADLLVTMDTPPLVLRWLWGFPIGRRWKRQILGFVGIRPVRVHCFGPVRRGGAERGLPRWRLRLARAAATASKLKRPPKGNTP